MGLYAEGVGRTLPLEGLWESMWSTEQKPASCARECLQTEGVLGPAVHPSVDVTPKNLLLLLAQPLPSAVLIHDKELPATSLALSIFIQLYQGLGSEVALLKDLLSHNNLPAVSKTSLAQTGDKRVFAKKPYTYSRKHQNRKDCSNNGLKEYAGFRQALERDRQRGQPRSSLDDRSRHQCLQEF